MTSIFNLSMPMFLLAFGLGATVDAFYKLVAIPSAAGVVQFIATVAAGATPQQIGAIVWKSIVRGMANPNGLLKEFLELLIAFLTEAEIIESFEDAIPLVGAILQAIGALGVIAEVAETSCELVLSPWTYEYDLVGTHDSLSPFYLTRWIRRDFPVRLQLIKLRLYSTMVLRKCKLLRCRAEHRLAPGPIHGSATRWKCHGQFRIVCPGRHSGWPWFPGTKNDVGSSVTITITEDLLPIRTGTTYQHTQKTGLDAQGNHVWSCKLPAPVAPESQSLCQLNPGNPCSFREITVSAVGYVGYGWQSFSTSPCQGASAQLDQLANIPIANSVSGNAQTGYALTPCSLGGAARLIYDPLGRPDSNFYVDTTQDVNVVRQVKFRRPGSTQPARWLGEY